MDQGPWHGNRVRDKPVGYEATGPVKRDVSTVRQRGISTPKKHNVILLFTGEAGEQHGYSDGWSGDALFLYTGEGQRGDMHFVRGNLALLDHAEAGKDVHLFEETRKGFVRYVGQFVISRSPVRIRRVA